MIYLLLDSQKNKSFRQKYPKKLFYHPFNNKSRIERFLIFFQQNFKYSLKKYIQINFFFVRKVENFI